MTAPPPNRLGSLRDRAVLRIAGATGSRGWSVAALAAIAAILLGQRAPVRGIPLAALVAAGLLLGAAAWLAVDALLARRAAPVAAATIVAVLALAAAGAVRMLTARLLHLAIGNALHLGAVAAVTIVAAAYLRAATGRGRRGPPLVTLAALASWAAYLDLTILVDPFRDARLYLVAGDAFARGAPVYMTAPLSRVPHDLADLPYLYPPFTLPLLSALARLPEAAGVAVIAGAGAVAVVAGLRLLGVGWRQMPLLLAWPPLAIGVQVGNVASIGFLLLAATWRYGAAAPLAGVFKAQSGVVALWLVRERRWRSLAIGAGAVAVLVLATLPITGVAIYGAWLRGLDHFQASLARFPSMMGLALQRYLPIAAAAGVAVAAVCLGLLAGGRQGLARLGVAAVVASPTVYIHGLAFGLPAVLMLDGVTAWGLLAVSPWSLGGWWMLAVAMAMLLMGLTRRAAAGPAPASGGGAAEAPRGGPVAVPADPPGAHAHPLAGHREPWPDDPRALLPRARP